MRATRQSTSNAGLSLRGNRGAEPANALLLFFLLPRATDDKLGFRMGVRAMRDERNLFITHICERGGRNIYRNS